MLNFQNPVKMVKLFSIDYSLYEEFRVRMKNVISLVCYLWQSFFGRFWWNFLWIDYKYQSIFDEVIPQSWNLPCKENWINNQIKIDFNQNNQWNFGVLHYFLANNWLKACNFNRFLINFNLIICLIFLHELWFYHFGEKYE